MYPIIFQYKMITIGSYGVFLGAAFYLSFLLLEREFKIARVNPDLAYKILMVVIPSAIIGAKLFHILENFSTFLKDPGAMIFSGGGLSVYGGFVLSFIIVYFLIRKNGESPMKIFDLASPPMALGYGIGRLACHVSGDGCYGIATGSFCGMAYPNGIVPTSVNVLPTPLMESFMSFMFFFILLQLRKRPHREGLIIFTYLILSGVARFSIEFVRLNHEIALGMTQAQIVGVVSMTVGVLGILFTARRNSKTAV